jgi:hypothetical protein
MISTMYEGMRNPHYGTGMVAEWNAVGRAVGGDVRAFQKQGDTAQKSISNLSVCRVSAWHKCSR